MTHVSGVEPSHLDSATIYVALDNHRRERLQAVRLRVERFRARRSARSRRTCRPIARAASYVIREDPVNPNLLYVGTETGVFASLNKGQSWFPLRANLPTVPVYDLKIHPRDRELIAGTHGRAIWILDVAPLQQMTTQTLAKAVHLFTPTRALRVRHDAAAERAARAASVAYRRWPDGAEIAYRLTANVPGVRVMVVDAAGDTIARLPGDSTRGLNR